MSATSARTGPLHLLLLALIVFLEYLQSGMVSFSSSYIMGGIGAAPEEFSLAAACYAAVAVVMIFKHRWLVERLGYRVFLCLALLFFALGAIACASADTVAQFIAGRMVQAVGGSAFFTAGRVQVQHYQGRARIRALYCFATGIFVGSGLAPFTAAALLDHVGWRAIFLVMLPLVLLVALMVEHGVPAHEPVEYEQRSRVHLAGTLSLAAGIFLLQFVLERSQYDIFSQRASLLLLGGLAVALIAAFVWHDRSRAEPLIPYHAFANGRYRAGLTLYFFCYLLISASAYMLPVFLVRGLGFTVTSIGWMLSLASLCGLITLTLHLKQLLRDPRIKQYLLFAFAVLFTFGWWMSRMSEEVSQWQLFWPILLNNGVFLAVAQGTAAFGTFRDVDEKVFSQAYQVKNVLREVANATGVSIATILLQMRSTLHYQRLAESVDPLGQWRGAPMARLAELAGLISRQATLMACQDYFWGLCVVALAAATVAMWQRRLV
jgi:MFS family permease